MFYDNLKSVCEKKGLKITPTVLKCGGSKGSLTAWKNGAMPNSDIVVNLSVFLNVPTDLLLMGEEKSPSLLEDKVRLLEMYDMLTDMEKGEILGELKQMTKKINIHTAEIAARSTNNDPPKVVIGDFSDILNAPDSTDDYKT